LASTAGQFRSPKGEYLLRFAYDDNGSMEGTGNYLHTGESFRFFSIWEGIKRIESILDKEKFPERTREFTTWAKEETIGREMASPVYLQEENGGRMPYMASFVIRVQYRHNSTWQGMVQWMEGMQLLHFKSVFELMKLVDTALERKKKLYGTTRLEGQGQAGAISNKGS
jgi:hypothetical protein